MVDTEMTERIITVIFSIPMVYGAYLLLEDIVVFIARLLRVTA